MYIFYFYEWNPSHFVVQTHFTNQYTTHKYLKHPEHSPMNLFGSLLTITYKHLPNCQLGKAFRKKPNSLLQIIIKKSIFIHVFIHNSITKYHWQILSNVCQRCLEKPSIVRFETTWINCCLPRLTLSHNIDISRNIWRF